VGLGLCVADACVLVTTPAEPAVANAVRARALARELDAGLVRIVLNRATDDGTVDALARELGAPVTALPESATLADAQARGQPVTQAAPDSEVAGQVERLAAAVQSSLSA
jgi:septum site-determining protein MinD